jgi:hypothetical protein
LSNHRKTGSVVIVNAVIWGAVIVATAYVLSGTGLMSKLIPILGVGAAASLFLVGGGVRK